MFGVIILGYNRSQLHDILLMDNIWQLLPEVLNDVILERLVEGDVVDFCGVAIL